jgi:hypothetical protein
MGSGGASGSRAEREGVRRGRLARMAATVTATAAAIGCAAGPAPPVIDLRPACHREEQRIRAHVTLCWLALLLVRIAETATDTTWNNIAGELDLVTLGHLHRPLRHLPADRRAHRCPARHPLQARHPPPNKIIQADPSAV